MPTFPNKDISAVRQRLLDGMTSYKEAVEATGDDCNYTEADIEQCKTIVDGYLASIVNGQELSQERIRDEIKNAVIALNELNKECDGSLIETDQREYLCELMLLAAKKAGLDTDDDITEEWREW